MPIALKPRCKFYTLGHKIVEFWGSKSSQQAAFSHTKAVPSVNRRDRLCDIATINY